MDSDKKKILNDYIKLRSLTNNSKTALRDIKNYINNFISSSKKPLKSFDEMFLINYIQGIKDKYSTEMLNKIKSSYLKNFIKWYYVDWSSRFRNLDTILKTEKAPLRFESQDMLSEQDVQKLVQDEESIFWKTYFMVLFYGSSRPSEICNLKWDMIEFDSSGAFLNIYSKKNKRTFIKFVPENVSAYLKKLKEKNKSEWVFYNETTKKPISEKGAYWRIKTLSQKSLNKKIDLYTLRHSIASILYNKEGVKDSDTANQMGHSQSMKGRYNHPNKDKLKAIARKIYLNPEELSPERKHELELEIEQLKKQNKQFKEGLNKLAKKLGINAIIQ